MDPKQSDVKFWLNWKKIVNFKRIWKQNYKEYDNSEKIGMDFKTFQFWFDLISRLNYSKEETFEDFDYAANESKVSTNVK